MPITAALTRLGVTGELPTSLTKYTTLLIHYAELQRLGFTEEQIRTLALLDIGAALGALLESAEAGVFTRP